MTARVLYLSHPQVAIDPSVPVPDWGLSPLGRQRTEAFATSPAIAGATRIIASRERKAIETAEILAAAHALDTEIHDDLHENDRSATGFLKPAEFEATADRFFAEPEASIRGWERAIDAQSRIVGAVERVLAEAPPQPLTVFVGHGGVGTLLICHCLGGPIRRQNDQPPGGGNIFLFEHPGWRLIHAWRPMETIGASGA